MRNGIFVQVCRSLIGGCHSPGFRGDYDARPANGIEQGTVAKSIAGAKDFPTAFIQNRKGKLTNEMFQAAFAPPLIGAQNQRSIGKLRAFRWENAEFRDQLRAVIETAIQNNRERRAL